MRHNLMISIFAGAFIFATFSCHALAVVVVAPVIVTRSALFAFPLTLFHRHASDIIFSSRAVFHLSKRFWGVVRVCWPLLHSAELCACACLLICFKLARPPVRPFAHFTLLDRRHGRHDAEVEALDRDARGDAVGADGPEILPETVSRFCSWFSRV